jgi:hypothetical protein
LVGDFEAPSQRLAKFPSPRLLDGLEDLRDNQGRGLACPRTSFAIGDDGQQHLFAAGGPYHSGPHPIGLLGGAAEFLGRGEQAIGAAPARF